MIRQQQTTKAHFLINKGFVQLGAEYAQSEPRTKMLPWKPLLPEVLHNSHGTYLLSYKKLQGFFSIT